jgi:hypothetical protein
MWMYTLSSLSNALWHPMQYVGLILVVIAVICLCAPKKKDDD